MESHDTSAKSHSSIALVPGVPIAQLVGTIYDEATTTERKKILACLLRPLGVLAVYGVANGIFAKILFRNGQHDRGDRLADISEVCAGDVIALVDYAQQLGADSLDGLTQLLAASPPMACSGTVAQLVTARLPSTASRNAGVAPTAASSLGLRDGEPAAQHLANAIQEPDSFL